MPYNQDIPGWMSHDELNHIEQLAASVPEYGNVLEIGSFMGRSTFAWAKSIPPSAIIHCVDTWDALPVINLDTLKGIRPSVPFNTIENFLRYTEDCHNIITYQGKSVMINDFQPRNFDIVFLDADHTNPVFHNDLISGYTLVTLGGLLCGHDFVRNRCPDVVNEVTKFAARLNLPVQTSNTSMIWAIRV